MHASYSGGGAPAAPGARRGRGRSPRRRADPLPSCRTVPHASPPPSAPPPPRPGTRDHPRIPPPPRRLRALLGSDPRRAGDRAPEGREGPGERAGCGTAAMPYGSTLLARAGERGSPAVSTARAPAAAATSARRRPERDPGPVLPGEPGASPRGSSPSSAVGSGEPQPGPWEKEDCLGVLRARLPARGDGREGGRRVRQSQGKPGSSDRQRACLPALPALLLSIPPSSSSPSLPPPPLHPSLALCLDPPSGAGRGGPAAPGP
ncbi:cuticle collagen 34-like [Haliaeetus albicilla]|uniref:cuticle collagen 34-like n=1 Tax=Haliaeetus albicilla TaxID=8969 RepID=UPI0037E86BAD